MKHWEYLCSNFIEKALRYWSFPVNYAKFLETLILWNICEWLLLHISWIISTWRKVSLYTIYCSFIWFNYVKSIRTKEIFWFIYNFKIKKLLWFLTIYYSLGSSSCFYSDTNTSTYTECLCDINVSHIFILHLASFTVPSQTIKKEWSNTIHL